MNLKQLTLFAGIATASQTQARLHQALADDPSTKANPKTRTLKSKKSHQKSPKPKANKYEVWGSDQSNSKPGQASLGVHGSFLWIWDSASIEHQLNGGNDAVPLSCTPDATAGPCDLLDIFPQTLVENDAAGTTGNILGDLNLFGRLHGMITDPQNKYVTANIFAPGGGYVAVINTLTKEAIGLFRVTSFDGAAAPKRSVHMSFWNEDGSAIIVDNLHGKAIERINVVRDDNGVIMGLAFDKSATIALGNGMTVSEETTFFTGPNAFGNDLLGSLSGTYADADLSELTPNGVCKENGCNEGPDAMAGGRTNNIPICPITSSSGKAYATLAGGGLLVLDTKTTPMSIVGEYGNAVINGAGCGGVQVGHQMFLNAGISASSAGATQSTFTQYSLDDTMFGDSPNGQNVPMPVKVFQDLDNTSTIGNSVGPGSNDSGQKPGTTTRRDSHGTVATVDGKYVHTVDRIQNVVEVFDSATYERTTYDLVSMDGKSGMSGPAGPCFARSVLDDGGLPLNDPAPDLLEATPDGKYLMVAFRGPAPVSVTHSAQGSCPGVGVIELTEGGKMGKLVDVLRATNTVTDSVTVAPGGGHSYSGSERGDVHGATVVANGW